MSNNNPLLSLNNNLNLIIEESHESLMSKSIRIGNIGIQSLRLQNQISSSPHHLERLLSPEGLIVNEGYNQVSSSEISEENNKIFNLCKIDLNRASQVLLKGGLNGCNCAPKVMIVDDNMFNLMPL